MEMKDFKIIKQIINIIVKLILFQDMEELFILLKKKLDLKLNNYLFYNCSCTNQGGVINFYNGNYIFKKKKKKIIQF